MVITVIQQANKANDDKDPIAFFQSFICNPHVLKRHSSLNIIVSSDLVWCGMGVTVDIKISAEQLNPAMVII